MAALNFEEIVKQLIVDSCPLTLKGSIFAILTPSSPFFRNRSTPARLLIRFTVLYVYPYIIRCLLSDNTRCYCGYCTFGRLCQSLTCCFSESYVHATWLGFLGELGFVAELGEASLDQGNDGGVLVVLGVIEGGVAIMCSEARISTSKQQGSHGLKLALGIVLSEGIPPPLVDA